MLYLNSNSKHKITASSKIEIIKVPLCNLLKKKRREMHLARQVSKWTYEFYPCISGCNEPVLHCTSFQSGVAGLILPLSSHAQCSAEICVLFSVKQQLKSPSHRDMMWQREEECTLPAEWILPLHSKPEFTKSLSFKPQPQGAVRGHLNKLVLLSRPKINRCCR